MKISIGVVIASLLIPPAAYGADLTDIFLSTAKRELVGNRVATPPVAEGKRSPIGPQLYRRVVDSVLLIFTKDRMGSGVVVSAEGHVLTNWHVVGQADLVGAIRRSQDLMKGVGQIKREHVLSARVVATDPRRDLALLHIPKSVPSLRHVSLGEPGGVEVGQDVYAIGHPKGLLWTYTEGVVSQIRPGFEWTYKDGTAHQAMVIQTQTPMHTGNSGGALFDGDGRVVGITTLQLQNDPTLNFAIAVSEVRDWAQSLSRK
jgi:putative serine protease PepD